MATIVQRLLPSVLSSSRHILPRALSTRVVFPHEEWDRTLLAMGMSAFELGCLRSKYS